MSTVLLYSRRTTSMRGVEIKHIRRRDVDLDAKALHIRKSKDEGSKRVLPLNDDAMHVFHDLRHTVVTRLLEAGEPDHVVESIT